MARCWATRAAGDLAVVVDGEDEVAADDRQAAVGALVGDVLGAGGAGGGGDAAERVVRRWCGRSSGGRRRSRLAAVDGGRSGLRVDLDGRRLGGGRVGLRCTTGPGVPSASAPETVVARAAPSSVLVLHWWCSLEVLLFQRGWHATICGECRTEPRNCHQGRGSGKTLALPWPGVVSRGSQPGQKPLARARYAAAGAVPGGTVSDRGGEPRGELGAGAHVELAVDPGQRGLDGLHAEVEPLGDLAVAGARGDLARRPGPRSR